MRTNLAEKIESAPNDVVIFFHTRVLAAVNDPIKHKNFINSRNFLDFFTYLGYTKDEVNDFISEITGEI